jgi:hypothetical protein
MTAARLAASIVQAESPEWACERRAHTIACFLASRHWVSR